VAQSFKRLTLDFSSGHDLRVVRLSAQSGSVLGVEPALSLSLCPSCPRKKGKEKEKLTDEPRSLEYQKN